MKKYTIGVDLGGRSAKFGVFTSDGSLIDKSNIATRVENKGQYILEDIFEHLKKIMEKYDLDEDNLNGIGIGVPGSVLSRGFVLQAVNLNWIDVDVRGFFEQRLDVPVYVENDANVAALGEAWHGAGKDYDNLLMVTLGTGVGGGIIINGDIVSGSTGSAGEIGHMPILEVPLKRTCGCGGHQCLELVAAAPGIEATANDYLFENEIESALREVDSIIAKDVFDAYKDGDEAAEAIVNIFFEHLGRGIANVTAVIDPQIVVIGGGVAGAGKVLIDGVQAVYKRHAFKATKEVVFATASLGNDAGIYGAAKLVIGAL